MEIAGRHIVGSHFVKEGFVFRATVHGNGAAGVQATPAWGLRALGTSPDIASSFLSSSGWEGYVSCMLLQAPSLSDTSDVDVMDG